ncbi:MAG: Ig-like domain-containing protein [Mycobacterium sp.]
MTHWAALITFASVLGCSNLTEGANGIVEVEIRQPAITTIQVGQTLQLIARALDKNGDPVNVAITWLATDSTLTVDAGGLVAGVAPGTGQVQAFAGTFPSARLALTVTAATGPIVGPE